MRRNAQARVSMIVMVIVSLVVAHPASARESCPVTDSPLNHPGDPTKTKPPIQASPTGLTYSVDTGDVMPSGLGIIRTCGTWSIEDGAPGKGHVWVSMYGYATIPPFGVPYDVPIISSPYVAVGNDQAGNPDNSDHDCVQGHPCSREKTSTYVCVSTNGQPSYGPFNGDLFCPVD